MDCSNRLAAHIAEQYRQAISRHASLSVNSIGTENGPDDIACWFVDTDYNDEAFFVRHAYFSGGGTDPFKRLKTTLKAEINEEAWSSLYSTVSRPFDKPTSGRIAVKAINHFGDEVLKVFSVN